MRAVRYHEFGGPEVLRIEEVDEPHAGPGEIRVVVSACAVNPVDWKFRRGFMGGDLPRGMGAEVSGVVDEVGDDVIDVSAGDGVFGPTSNGAADFAVLSHYAQIPARLDFVHAAALPTAAETAVRCLDLLGVTEGQTLLVNGAGGAVGAAVVQLAVDRGATVIATASERNHERLSGYGAAPTTYGDGLAQRVAQLAPDGIDRVLDMSPAQDGVLAELVAIAGDPDHVLTISNFETAEAAGVATTGGGAGARWDALDHIATLAERGELEIPVQATFPLEDVAEAEAVSEAGHVTGKLVLLVE